MEEFFWLEDSLTDFIKNAKKYRKSCKFLVTIEKWNYPEEASRQLELEIIAIKQRKLFMKKRISLKPKYR